MAKRPQQKIEEYCNKFNKAFKNGPPKIKLKKKDHTPSAGVPSAGSSLSLPGDFNQSTDAPLSSSQSRSSPQQPPPDSSILLSQPGARPAPLQAGFARSALLMPLSKGHPRPPFACPAPPTLQLHLSPSSLLTTPCLPPSGSCLLSQFLNQTLSQFFSDFAGQSFMGSSFF